MNGNIIDNFPYKWNYWRVEYLAICSNIAIEEILNWRISVLHGKRPWVCLSISRLLAITHVI